MTANTEAERVKRLKSKYGAAVIDNGLRLRPDDFVDEVEIHRDEAVLSRFPNGDDSGVGQNFQVMGNGRL